MSWFQHLVHQYKTSFSHCGSVNAAFSCTIHYSPWCLFGPWEWTPVLSMLPKTGYISCLLPCHKGAKQQWSHDKGDILRKLRIAQDQKAQDFLEKLDERPHQSFGRLQSAGLICGLSQRWLFYGNENSSLHAGHGSLPVCSVSTASVSRVQVEEFVSILFGDCIQFCIHLWTIRQSQGDDPYGPSANYQKTRWVDRLVGHLFNPWDKLDLSLLSASLLSIPMT